jgi:hypothetical protein
MELHLQRCNMKIFTYSKCCGDIANSKFDTIWHNIENQMQTQMVEDWTDYIQQLWIKSYQP